jgi:energy-coupling factor transporter ATP-binding protein EcfA2
VINPANLLFIGLPGSGKTTFLAALWHVLSDRSSATTLKLTKLSGDRTYLNQITKEWRECSQVPRTNLQSEQVVVLHLAGDGFGSFDLSIPDLAGEAFKQQLTDRRISRRHDALVQAATGVMLFLHPDVQKGTQLTLARQLEATLPGGQNGDTSATNTGQNAWSPDLLPHQAKLVELLQFLLERTQRKLRVAVVVSAWDLVEGLGKPPHAFIARELPLLQQFLEANDDLLEHAVFGVSAQGGDITVASEKQLLLDLDDALKRIKVRQDQDTGHDITKPIAWLLGAFS